MARYTFETAHIKAEYLKRELEVAEDNYIYALEKVLLREHFKNGKLNPSAYLSGMSKLELSASFKVFQDTFIKYIIMKNLAHELCEARKNGK